ncbi:MAG: NAD(P)H-binding protein [Saprospiraceae bacterium]|nr:NAD(P)H-binding protein [Saprospiraceae bacterium]MBK7810807.1 NAD(P)H-binding protein [Saprospiraceae bacterium]MBK9630402.1 NAD(P)H-binding protein [Saprospiraceae bacterium]
METVLVIGATGQLGYAITEKLAKQNRYKVRAMYREGSDTSALEELNGVELCKGDLLDAESLAKALEQVDVVIATANPVVPTRKTDNFKTSVEGYRNLIQKCNEAHIKQFIYTSGISFGPYSSGVGLSVAKSQIEDMLTQSGLNYTILIAAAFMDIHLAFMGSDLPLRGTKVSSLNRKWKFMNNFYDGVKHSIEKKSVFLITGKGDQPTSYICVEDVAEFHVNAIGNPLAENKKITIGGPEALTTMDVKTIFEEIYQKPLKVKSTPAFVLKGISSVMVLFDPVAANILQMQYAASKVSGAVENTQEIASKFGVQLSSVKEYLNQKFNIGRVK